MKYGRSKKGDLTHKLFGDSYYSGHRKRCGGRGIDPSQWVVWSDGSRKTYSENEPWNFVNKSDEEKAFYVLAKNKKYPIPPAYLLEGLPCTKCFPDRAETVKMDCPTCGTLKTWLRPKGMDPIKDVAEVKEEQE